MQQERFQQLAFNDFGRPGAVPRPRPHVPQLASGMLVMVIDERVPLPVRRLPLNGRKAGKLPRHYRS